MQHEAVKDLIRQLQLQPHPEGGYYRETYRAAETMAAASLPGRFTGDRVFSTAIYFLLEKGNFSAFHRIQSDECWHFYAGDPLQVHVIYPDGRYGLIRLGNDPVNGCSFQAVVPAGCWFASETALGGSYSLVGCTVAPGFDFADFELAKQAELLSAYPSHATVIRRLCRQ
ncbi:cupin domain-containing protein [Sediminibacterium soli]|uniref:cupin domain-containing protein n=1 Tax=Sediminibacterium soli TaxID=2698829 RepID=UPI00137A24DD|nr:cupin domain-containing protein [Sediminibacterium soli]NCI46526.1 cupin domain-containing protein [Sediminibacterium soli]